MAGTPETPMPRRRLRDDPMWLAQSIWTVVFLLAGIFAAVLVSQIVSPRLSTFASAFLFSIASLAVGVFFGFLFGVPRTHTREPTGTTVELASTSEIHANTNLEQISDWLTKLLIGATLVQLANVPSAAARLFDAMAPALGGTASSAALAGGIVIYFVVLGFLMGWLNARLYLGTAMQNADAAALLFAAKQAQERGEPDEAEALMREAQARVVKSGSAGPPTTE